jgi:hypothetical protein
MAQVNFRKRLSGIPSKMAVNTRGLTEQESE